MPRACLKVCPEDGLRCHGYEEEPHEDHYHYINEGNVTVATHKWRGEGVYARMLVEEDA